MRKSPGWLRKKTPPLAYRARVWALTCRTTSPNPPPRYSRQPGTPETRSVPSTTDQSVRPSGRPRRCSLAGLLGRYRNHVQGDASTLRPHAVDRDLGGGGGPAGVVVPRSQLVQGTTGVLRGDVVGRFDQVAEVAAGLGQDVAQVVED